MRLSSWLRSGRSHFVPCGTERGHRPSRLPKRVPPTRSSIEHLEARIALSAFTPTPDAAATIAPFTVVMLAFFSGIWIPVDQLPHWLETVGKIFPLYHLALGLQTTLSPEASGSGLDGENLLILAIWAVAGARIASRRFLWEPQAAGS